MYEFYRKGIMVLTPLCIFGALFLGKILLFDMDKSAEQSNTSSPSPAATQEVADDKQEYFSDDVDFKLDSNTSTNKSDATAKPTTAPKQNTVTEKPNNGYSRNNNTSVVDNSSYDSDNDSDSNNSSNNNNNGGNHGGNHYVPTKRPVQPTVKPTQEPQQPTQQPTQQNDDKSDTDGEQ